MIQYILKRLGMVIPTFIGVSILTFSLIHLIPGDPVTIMGGERGVSAEQRAEMEKTLGLDKPIIQQYLVYTGNVLKGDLGTSFVTREPVMDEFLTLFPATIELAFFAAVFAALVGLPLGILAAVKRGSVLDHTVMTISLTGYSMPIFWWGLLLILFMSIQLDLTPVSGRIDVMFWVDEVTGFMIIDAWLSGEEGAVASALHHLILPSVVLGTIPMAVIARMTRSSMLEVLGEDYIRTARAKGLSPIRVVMKHALRNALIPVITVIGLQIGTLLSGAILTETIFAWPGIGKWLIEAIGRRDYPVVQGGLLMIAVIIIITNLLVDLTYGVINPRVRHR
ncbi:ABC transporter permease subunit [Reinekea marinisedimentorum]|uniref:Dipeptide transport system permease protein n=1 Tax=Reinekea marinisedimentorum TaxID=230495 RepID=A0A4R3I3V0_9GAMM|nr:ABC transporter permease subunit [Reinekea marinisedimentorum]TCS40396.1 dipeptide transport system permease protein [Reinekea marinisedimentorum]